MYKVLLDTNFLMLLPIFYGDILQELDTAVDGVSEKIILVPVYKELLVISQKGDMKSKKQAEMAIKFIEKYKIKIVDVNLKPLEKIDDLLIRTAKMWGCYVATNDRKLRKKLSKLNLPVVYLRQRIRLEARGKPS